MAIVDVDVKELVSFFSKVEKATKGDFKVELEQFLESIGFEFLRILEDEIIRRKVMDTRLLLSSFQKGNNENVWDVNESGLSLEIGTSVEYAKYVNDGHWTCTKGETSRFVPGYWKGDQFIYDRSASGGMVLKQRWVEGKHYWESAFRILERIFPEIIEKKLQNWLDNYLGGN